MNLPRPYQLLADVVLSLHVAIVVFIVGGLVFIIVGNLRAWRWANALWFRAARLTAIAVAIAEAWIGVVCPLTTFEMWLRAKARATTYAGSFVEHWLQRIPILRSSSLGLCALLLAGRSIRRSNMVVLSAKAQPVRP